MLAITAPERTTIAEIGRAHGISEHHLVKVIRGLTQFGYVETARGKDGGVRLCVDPAAINIGRVVEQMEPELGVVACLRAKPDKPCVIAPACRLSSILHEATERFLDALRQYTLADVLAEREAFARLLQLTPNTSEKPLT